MAKEETLRRVIGIVREHLAIEETREISAATTICDDLGADNLDAVEISLECEEAFDILLPQDIEHATRTVAELADEVERALSLEGRLS